MTNTNSLDEQEDSKTVLVKLRCPKCENPRARVIRNAGHLTARCEQCDAYIKHISKDEFRGMLNPHENALRKQIKELVSIWVEVNKKESWAGWNHLYNSFKEQHSIDLLQIANKLRVEKQWPKVTGVDAADELGMLEQLHDLAISMTDPDIVENRIPAQFLQIIQEEVFKQLPPQVVRAIEVYKVNIFQIYDIIDSHARNYSPAQQQNSDQNTTYSEDDDDGKDKTAN